MRYIPHLCENRMYQGNYSTRVCGYKDYSKKNYVMV
jgi:hypothetical protein